MTDKIVRFPLGHAKRKRLDLQRGVVRCEVSNRWIQFPKEGAALETGTFLAVDVMTDNAEGTPRKLCELILVKEDLLAVIASIHAKDE